MGFESELQIVLGSSSKWRAQVLRDAGLHFTQMSPDIDEKAIRHSSPAQLTRMIAGAKSKALRDRLRPNDMLITSDQVVSFRGMIREKPADADEAARWLREYASAPVCLVSAVTVFDAGTGRAVDGVETATVRFKPSLVGAIPGLVSDIDTLQSCGALVIEHPLAAPHVEAAFRPYAEALRQTVYGPEALAIDEETAIATCISGLPLQLTFDLLARLGRRNYPLPR